MFRFQVPDHCLVSPKHFEREHLAPKPKTPAARDVGLYRPSFLEVCHLGSAKASLLQHPLPVLHYDLLTSGCHQSHAVQMSSPELAGHLDRHVVVFV